MNTLVNHRRLAAAVFFFAFLIYSPSALALQPDEVLVLANKNASSSLALAEYYMEKRGIPQDHLLKLWVTDKEECTRRIMKER